MYLVAVAVIFIGLCLYVGFQNPDRLNVIQAKKDSDEKFYKFVADNIRG